MFAFATLLLSNKNEMKYAEMIVVLYKSLKTKYKFIVLCPENLKNKTKEFLIKYGLILHYIDIIETDYKVKWKRYQKEYENWIHLCLTKLSVLTLTKYKKVLFLDSDMLARKNIDNIFDKPTPSGILTAVDFPDNKLIPQDILHQSLNAHDGYGISGSFMLLKPSKRKYNEAVKNINKYLEIAKKINPGLDEIAFSLLYENEWNSLSYLYSTKAYTPKLLKDAILIHYVAGKPFEKKNAIYDDVKEWIKKKNEYIT